MGSDVKMISFRLNRDRAGDRMIWDYLESKEANRSQTIKELLVQSIEEGTQKTSGRGENLLQEQVLLLLKIQKEMEVLKNMEAMREQLQNIYQRLSLLPEIESPQEVIDEAEEALLKTIFEENPIEVIQ